MSAKYKFSCRVVEGDKTGYYFPRWDRAQKVSVIAESQNEAMKKIGRMMGELKQGWIWLIHIDQTEEVQS